MGGLGTGMRAWVTEAKKKQDQTNFFEIHLTLLHVFMFFFTRTLGWVWVGREQRVLFALGAFAGLPLRSISLYELIKEPGIYIALSSLEPRNLDYAVHSFPAENLMSRPVILSLSKTPAADAFCLNLPHQRILPTGNSWGENLRKIHRSPVSLREVDYDDNSFECVLLDAKGNATSYSTYYSSLNTKLLNLKIIL
nr:hypothetical protein [Lacrimispora amygdalina]